MAEGGRTFSAQNALNTCVEHEHEDIDMYCKTCKKPICTKCVKEDHHSHDWDSLNKVAKALRKDSRRKKMEMESVAKSVFTGIEADLKTLTMNEENQYTMNQTGMESSRKAIIASVNKMFKEMKLRSDKDHESKMKNFRERNEQMTSKKKRLQFLIQNIETGAKDYTDADLVELYNEINLLIDDLTNTAIISYSWYHRQIFKPGSYEEASLIGIVGSIETEKKTCTAVFQGEFYLGETSTNCIVPMSENEAWMHSTRTTNIKLVDKRGHSKKSMDLKCHIYNFVVSDQKIIYFCDLDAKRVCKIDNTGKINILFSTAPLFPVDINLTHSCDFLVTLVDKESKIRNNSSRRLLRRISLTGETLREYEYDENTKRSLFTFPASPIEHSDGRVCVINSFENDDGCIVGAVYGFSGIGSVLFKYIDINDEFNPIDICCAPAGFTLVSDCVRRKIHILTPNGLFLRFLLSEDTLNEDAYSIALKGSTLWIGSHGTGLVKVFKHTL